MAQQQQQQQQELAWYTEGLVLAQSLEAMALGPGVQQQQPQQAQQYQQQQPSVIYQPYAPAAYGGSVAAWAPQGLPVMDAHQQHGHQLLVPPSPHMLLGQQLPAAADAGYAPPPRSYAAAGGGWDGGRGGGMPARQAQRQGPPPPPQQQQQAQAQPLRRRQVPQGMEDNVRRTIYVTHIDQQVTEEMLATFFSECGTVLDCRICGDQHSAMRFAFIEFTELGAAQQALTRSNCKLGSSTLRVLPSKTAIVPVNTELMPHSHEELERCSRTVYVANIDRQLQREDVRAFFEQLCGPVSRLRLLGDMAHPTRIAFLEFEHAEGAMAALNTSGATLGALPLRVSPSKTPVRGDRDDRQSRQQGPRQARPGCSGGRAGGGGSSAAAGQLLQHPQ